MTADFIKRLIGLETKSRIKNTDPGAEFWDLNADGSYSNERMTLTPEAFEKYKEGRPHTVFLIDNIPDCPIESE
jgi:hypothetical protein